MTEWFTEKLELAHGSGLTVKIKKKLSSVRSKYQKIEVYETYHFGKMLVIDDIIMFTEMDEFAYHEMLSHVPVQAHKNPKSILIIGGGDGGVVRELIKYPFLECFDLCDIDGEVTKVAKKYFPMVSSGLSDKRVNVRHEDGLAYAKKNNKKYDIAIVDSTDPIGPGANLFKKEFYQKMFEALKEDGILITQCESIYYHKKIIGEALKNLRMSFPRVFYYNILVPTYPSGMIGAGFSTKKYDYTENLGARKVPLGLKYYSHEVHKASFVLPEFAQKIVS